MKNEQKNVNQLCKFDRQQTRLRVRIGIRCIVAIALTLMLSLGVIPMDFTLTLHTQAASANGKATFRVIADQTAATGTSVFKLSSLFVADPKNYPTVQSYASINIMYPSEFTLNPGVAFSSWTSNANTSPQNPTHSIYIDITNPSADGSKYNIESYLQGIRFELKPGAVFVGTPQVRITLSSDSILLFEDSDGFIHAYQWVPVNKLLRGGADYVRKKDGTKLTGRGNGWLSWFESYNEAQYYTYDFGDGKGERAGYMATLESLEEQVFMYTSIAKQPGWLGGTATFNKDGSKIGTGLYAPNNTVNEISENRNDYDSINATTDAWYWTTGPSTGKVFYSQRKYSAGLTDLNGKPNPYNNVYCNGRLKDAFSFFGNPGTPALYSGNHQNGTLVYNGVSYPKFMRTNGVEPNGTESFLQFAYNNESTWNDEPHNKATNNGFYVEWGGDLKMEDISYDEETEEDIPTANLKANLGVTDKIYQLSSQRTEAFIPVEAENLIDKNTYTNKEIDGVAYYFITPLSDTKSYSTPDVFLTKFQEFDKGANKSLIALTPTSAAFGEEHDKKAGTLSINENGRYWFMTRMKIDNTKDYKEQVAYGGGGKTEINDRTRITSVDVDCFYEAHPINITGVIKNSPNAAHLYPTEIAPRTLGEDSRRPHTYGFPMDYPLSKGVAVTSPSYGYDSVRIAAPTTFSNTYWTTSDLGHQKLTLDQAGYEYLTQPGGATPYGNGLDGGAYEFSYEKTAAWNPSSGSTTVYFVSDLNGAKLNVTLPGGGTANTASYDRFFPDGGLFASASQPYSPPLSVDGYAAVGYFKKPSAINFGSVSQPDMNAWTIKNAFGNAFDAAYDPANPVLYIVYSAGAINVTENYLVPSADLTSWVPMGGYSSQNMAVSKNYPYEKTAPFIRGYVAVGAKHAKNSALPITDDHYDTYNSGYAYGDPQDPVRVSIPSVSEAHTANYYFMPDTDNNRIPNAFQQSIRIEYIGERTDGSQSLFKTDTIIGRRSASVSVTPDSNATGIIADPTPGDGGRTRWFAKDGANVPPKDLTFGTDSAHTYRYDISTRPASAMPDKDNIVKMRLIDAATGQDIAVPQGVEAQGIYLHGSRYSRVAPHLPGRIAVGWHRGRSASNQTPELTAQELSSLSDAQIHHIKNNGVCLADFMATYANGYPDTIHFIYKELAQPALITWQGITAETTAYPLKTLEVNGYVGEAVTIDRGPDTQFGAQWARHPDGTPAAAAESSLEAITVTLNAGAPSYSGANSTFTYKEKVENAAVTVRYVKGSPKADGTPDGPSETVVQTRTVFPISTGAFPEIGGAYQILGYRVTAGTITLDSTGALTKDDGQGGTNGGGRVDFSSADYKAWKLKVQTNAAKTVTFWLESLETDAIIRACYDAPSGISLPVPGFMEQKIEGLMAGSAYTASAPFIDSTWTLDSAPAITKGKLEGYGKNIFEFKFKKASGNLSIVMRDRSNGDAPIRALNYELVSGEEVRIKAGGDITQPDGTVILGGADLSAMHFMPEQASPVEQAFTFADAGTPQYIDYKKERIDVSITTWNETTNSQAGMPVIKPAAARPGEAHTETAPDLSAQNLSLLGSQSQTKTVTGAHDSEFRFTYRSTETGTVAVSHHAGALTGSPSGMPGFPEYRADGAAFDTTSIVAQTGFDLQFMPNDYGGYTPVGYIIRGGAYAPFTAAAQAQKIVTLPSLRKSGDTVAIIYRDDRRALSYDLSGRGAAGTGELLEIAPEKVAAGARIVAPTPLWKDDQTKSNAAFAPTGWELVYHNGATEVRAPLAFGAAAAMPDADAVLVLKCASKEYRATYMANGDEVTGMPEFGASPKVNWTLAEAGKAAAIAAGAGANGNPSRTGYTFNGYAIQPQSVSGITTGGGSDATLTDAGDTFMMPESDVVITAQWLPVIHTVTYKDGLSPADRAAGKAVSNMPPVISVTDAARTVYNKNFIIGAAVPVHSDGLFFAGWESDATSTSYSAGGLFKMPDTDVTLTAKWAVSVATVAYDLGGGTGGAVGGSFAENNVIRFFAADEPSKVGHIFEGWTLGSDPTPYRHNSPDPAHRSYTITNADAASAALLGFTAKYSPLGGLRVTYDIDGDTTALTDPAAYDYGAAVTVLPAAKKPGYYFAGWQMFKTGDAPDSSKDPVYYAGAKFPMPPHGATLKAVWTQNPAAYKVTYALGDGAVADAGTPQEAASIPAGSLRFGQTAVISASVLSRPGHRFDGYLINGIGTLRLPGEAFAMPDSDVTLLAKWTVLGYPITYMNDEDSNAPTKIKADGQEKLLATQAGSIAYNANVTLPGAPVKAGHTFKGFKITDAKGGHVTTVGINGSFRMPDSAVSISPEWGVDEYIAYFDANGGSPSGSAIFTAASPIAAPPAPLSAPSGKSFAGWNSAQDGSGATYAAGADITAAKPSPPASFTLYAKWANRTAITATYDAGHTDPLGVPPQSNHAYEATVTVGAPPTGLNQGHTSDNMVFAGWLWESAGETPRTYQPGDTFRMPANAVRMTAQWAQRLYTVTYLYGSDVTASIAANPAPLAYRAAVALYAPTRPGYRFMGWTSSATGTSIKYGGASGVGSYAMPPQDILMSANWEPLKYNLKYEKDPAKASVEANAANIYAQATQADYGSAVAMPPDPYLTDNSFEFAGWREWDGAAFTGPVYRQGSGFNMPGRDVTLRSTWDALTHPIVYDQGAAAGAANLPQSAASYAQGVPVQVSAQVPTYYGHTFANWRAYKASDTTNAIATVGANGIFTMPTGLAPNEAVYLVAQWNANPPVDITVKHVVKESTYDATYIGKVIREEIITVPSKHGRYSLPAAPNHLNGNTANGQQGTGSQDTSGGRFELIGAANNAPTDLTVDSADIEFVFEYRDLRATVTVAARVQGGGTQPNGWADRKFVGYIGDIFSYAPPAVSGYANTGSPSTNMAGGRISAVPSDNAITYYYTPLTGNLVLTVIDRETGAAIGHASKDIATDAALTDKDLDGYAPTAADIPALASYNAFVNAPANKDYSAVNRAPIPKVRMPFAALPPDPNAANANGTGTNATNGTNANGNAANATNGTNANGNTANGTNGNTNSATNGNNVTNGNTNSATNGNSAANSSTNSGTAATVPATLGATAIPDPNALNGANATATPDPNAMPTPDPNAANGTNGTSGNNGTAAATPDPNAANNANGANGTNGTAANGTNGTTTPDPNATNGSNNANNAVTATPLPDAVSSGSIGSPVPDPNAANSINANGTSGTSGTATNAVPDPNMAGNGMARAISPLALIMPKATGTFERGTAIYYYTKKTKKITVVHWDAQDNTKISENTAQIKGVDLEARVGEAAELYGIVDDPAGIYSLDPNMNAFLTKSGGPNDGQRYLSVPIPDDASPSNVTLTVYYRKNFAGIINIVGRISGDPDSRLYSASINKNADYLQALPGDYGLVIKAADYATALIRSGEYVLVGAKEKSALLTATKATDTVYFDYARASLGGTGGGGQGSHTVINRYAVNYFAPDADVASVPAAHFKEENAQLTLSSQVPVRAGYLFAGWFDTISGQMYQSGAKYLSNAAAVLIAQWTPTESAAIGADGLKGGARGADVGDIVGQGGASPSPTGPPGNAKNGIKNDMENGIKNGDGNGAENGIAENRGRPNETNTIDDGYWQYDAKNSLWHYVGKTLPEVSGNDKKETANKGFSPEDDGYWQYDTATGEWLYLGKALPEGGAIEKPQTRAIAYVIYALIFLIVGGASGFVLQRMAARKR